MIARYLTQNKQITFEVEGESQKAIFEQIASIQEVFDAEHQCGMCKSPHIRFMVRTVTKGTKTYDFYHLACQACHARFDFGQSTEGGALFPKRKDKDGNWIPNNGWTKYNSGRSDGPDDSEWT